MSLKDLHEEVKQKAVQSITLSDGKEVELIDGLGAGKAFLEHMDQVWAGKSVSFTTGFNELDMKTGGFRAGDLWVIGGMTSMGKSALALQMILNAMKSGANSLFFSMEMSVKSIMARAVSHLGEIHIARLTREKQYLSHGLKYDEKTKHVPKTGPPNGLTVVEHIMETIKEIKRLNPIFIDDPFMNIDQIVETCMSYNSNIKKLDLIVVDYMQLVPSTNADSRERQVAAVSNALKKLAVATNATVICPVQLNEKQRIRESRVIQQDACVYIQIKADQDKFDKENEIVPLGICIPKNRDGEQVHEPLSIKLDGAFQTFRSDL